MNTAHDTVVDWLLVADPALLRRETLSEGGGSLTAHLRRHGLNELASQLVPENDEDGTPAPAQAIEFVLAEALAEYVTLDPSRQRFETAEQLLHHEDGVWRNFRDRTADVLRSNVPRLAALRARLACEPDLILSDPGSVALHSRWSPSELAGHHADTASERNMWQSAGFANLHMTSEVEYRILRLVDPAAWLAILERFALPQPVFSLVEDGMLDDATEIAVLLAAASPAYDSEGIWDRERVVPFQLLTAAERVLQRHAGLARNVGPVDEAAFATEVDAVVSSLSHRADATWLGHAWLQQLAWQDRMGRAWHRSPPTGGEAPLWKIMSAVAARLAPLPDPVAWIGAEDETWRCDRLVACLLPVVLGASPATAADILEGVIDDNLVPSTSLACTLRGTNTVFVRTTAAALSGIKDPSAWLRAMWLNCFAARDKLRTWHGGTERKRLDPGALAASCACALLVRTAGEDQRCVATTALWETLRKSVVDATLTNVGQSEVWTLLARWLILIFAKTHAALDDAERIQRLGALLNPLRHTSSGFLQLLRDLVDQGVAVTEIDAVLEGPSLEAVVRRTLADARRACRTDFNGRQALAALEEVASQLLEAAAVAGGSSGAPPPARASP